MSWNLAYKFVLKYNISEPGFNFIAQTIRRQKIAKPVKGPPINYVTRISRFLDPLPLWRIFIEPPLVAWLHTITYIPLLLAYNILSRFILPTFSSWNNNNLKSKKDIWKFFNLTFVTSQFLRSPGTPVTNLRCPLPTYFVT